MQSFYTMIACLRKNRIHLVAVYDNKAPPEKIPEQRQRHYHRMKMRKKIEPVLTAWHEIEHTLTDGRDIPMILHDYMKNMNKQITRLTPESMLCIKYEMKKLENQMTIVRTADFEETKVLFQMLNIPIVQSCMEAEGTCAKLCMEKHVDGVLSEDTDVLPFGAPVMLHRLNVKDETVVILRLKDILKILHLTMESFIDFCIMCGTDYNPNMFMIGSEKAFNYISIYKNIENIKACMNHIPTHVLNFERVRHIFQHAKQTDFTETHIPLCGDPDTTIIYGYLDKNNIDYTSFRQDFIDSVPHQNHDKTYQPFFIQEVQRSTYHT